METREFDVIETRHFIILTERGSRCAFRIAASDGMLLGGLSVHKWRTGDVVRLSEVQQRRLAELDARCREMGDEAAVRDLRIVTQLISQTSVTKATARRLPAKFASPLLPLGVVHAAPTSQLKSPPLLPSPVEATCRRRAEVAFGAPHRRE